MPVPLAVLGSATRVGSMVAAGAAAIDRMKEYGEASADYMATYSPPELRNAMGSDDAADAFRHAFSSAKMARELGDVTATVAGTLWEYKGMIVNRAPDAETGMDLWNNAKGRELAALLPENASNKEIGDTVMAALRNGQLVLTPSDPRALEAAKSVLTPSDVEKLAGAVMDSAKGLLEGADRSTVARLLREGGALDMNTISALARGAEKLPGMSDLELSDRFSRSQRLQGNHDRTPAGTPEAGNSLAGFQVPGMQFTDRAASYPQPDLGRDR